MRKEIYVMPEMDTYALIEDDIIAVSGGGIILPDEDV